MTRFTSPGQRILAKHSNPFTKSVELVLLGYCSNEEASEHISRYLLASRFARGVVLDVASGTCYGSSILRRASGVKTVVSVDLDEDALKYGRMVYGADCVRADATRLPFRRQAFDSIISLETLEHVGDHKAFLGSIKASLKEGGKLILSTPNKMYASPFLPKPLNPYHVNELYLGQLVNLLKICGFKVEKTYGGIRVKHLEFLRRILGSLLKFLLIKFSLRPYVLDVLYNSIYRKLKTSRLAEALVDPDPSLFPHEEVEVSSNIALYKYFVVICTRP